MGIMYCRATLRQWQPPGMLEFQFSGLSVQGKKKQEKVAEMTQALRMDLYETEGTNQG